MGLTLEFIDAIVIGILIYLAKQVSKAYLYL